MLHHLIKIKNIESIWLKRILKPFIDNQREQIQKIDSLSFKSYYVKNKFQNREL